MYSALLSNPAKLSFLAFLVTWGIATLSCFLGLNAFYLWGSRKHPDWKIEPGMLFSVFWGVAAAVSLLGSIFYTFEDPIRQVHAFLSAFGGAVFGWGLGMYLTPQDATERGQFAKIGAAATAALSGYGVRSFQQVAQRPDFHNYMWYLFIAVLGAALTTAAIYNTRAYGTNFVKIGFDHADTEDKTKAKVKLGETIKLRGAVSGQDDTSVAWTIIPSSYGSVVDREFKPTATGNCKVKAESLSDPSLCAVLDVKIEG